MKDKVFLKILGPNRSTLWATGHKWPQINRWTVAYDYLSMCKQGWHLTPIGRIKYWLVEAYSIYDKQIQMDLSKIKIYLAKGRGETITQHSKSVFSQARLLTDITPTVKEYLSCLTKDGEKYIKDNKLFGLPKDFIIPRWL